MLCSTQVQVQNERIKASIVAQNVAEDGWMGVEGNSSMEHADKPASSRHVSLRT